MVIALAGRRIDPPNTPNPAFPVENIDAVRTSLSGLFETQKAATLVCSAACGADLIALDIAGRLGMRRRVLLPFAPNRFRESSVIDRPGDWGAIYDRVIAEAEGQSDLLIIDSESDDDAAYAAVNIAILDEAVAIALARDERPMAVLVWEGTARGELDITGAFGASARARKIPVVELTTL